MLFKERMASVNRISAVHAPKTHHQNVLANVLIQPNVPQSGNERDEEMWTTAKIAPQTPNVRRSPSAEPNIPGAEARQRPQALRRHRGPKYGALER